jgi:hypothetical protein
MRNFGYDVREATYQVMKAFDSAYKPPHGFMAAEDKISDDPRPMNDRSKRLEQLQSTSHSKGAVSTSVQHVVAVGE